MAKGTLTIGSLFSGIGGLEFGLELSGLGPTVWQVEQDPFCLRVLSRHWPKTERFTDVRQVGKSTLSPVSIICGGFPCTDLSSAGKGAGLAGERSGLWREFARIVGEMRPDWVVVENVASGARRWVDAIRSGLEQLGYASLPVPLSAFDVGAPHRRNRVFIIANSNSSQIREPAGWTIREDWQSKVVSGNNGEIRDASPRWTASDPNGTRNGVQSIPWNKDSSSDATGSIASRCDSGPSGWAAPPELCGMDDGVPDQLDRNRALGNAVCPQCAECVGWMIRELIGGAYG